MSHTPKPGRSYRVPPTLESLTEEVAFVADYLDTMPHCEVLVSPELAAFAVRWHRELVERAERIAAAAVLVQDTAARIMREREGKR